MYDIEIALKMIIKKKRAFSFQTYLILYIRFGVFTAAATCSRGSSLADFFHSEDGGDLFLRNIGSHKNYTALHETAFLAILFHEI
jgi:hypothetical protein